MKSKHTLYSGLLASTAALVALAGCAPRPAVTMAPPGAMPAPPMAQAGMGAPSGMNNVYQWQDVPVGQEVPITRGIFDQGGYQLFAGSGETIVIPFVNQNMYVMKFGMSTNGGMYFVNDGTTPTLYVPQGGYLENAAAQGARWYPFSNGFQYSRPVYIGLAPTWSDFVGMGWYPGMSYYGGYWGYSPWHYGMTFAPMGGLYFNIGGHPYYGWSSYHNYYRSYPTGRIGWSSYRPYNYTSVGRRANTTGSFGRSVGSTGSFGRSSGSSFGRSSGSSFGRNSASNSSGSFGRGATSSTFGRSSGSFGTSSGGSSFGRPSGGSSGSFGGGSSNTFGTARNTPSGGAFGSGRTGSFGSGSSSFGTSSGSRSSFGSGSSGFGGSSSFGRSSSGSSFGRSSSGSSFGGSSSFGRSSGGSFGRRR